MHILNIPYRNKAVFKSTLYFDHCAHSRLFWIIKLGLELQEFSLELPLLAVWSSATVSHLMIIWRCITRASPPIILLMAAVRAQLTWYLRRVNWFLMESESPARFDHCPLLFQYCPRVVDNRTRVYASYKSVNSPFTNMLTRTLHSTCLLAQWRRHRGGYCTFS